METNVNEAAKPTTRKERNKLIHAYILGCIDGEGYDNWLPTFTNKEKVKFLFDTFNSEVGKWNTPRIGEQVNILNVNDFARECARNWYDDPDHEYNKEDDSFTFSTGSGESVIVKVSKAEEVTKSEYNVLNKFL